MKLIAIIFIFVVVLVGLSQSTYPNFYYYPKANVKAAVYKSTGLLGSSFRNKSQTVFVVHGWETNFLSKNAAYFSAIRDALLTYTPGNNVIVVDWFEGANVKYAKAVINVRKSAKGISDFITRNNLDPSLIYCVGHSLGAQVCGFVGKYLNGKMARITGLDPAGPSFDILNSQNRLAPSDAQFVDVIHTTQLLGTELSVGYYDFFPNFDNNPFTNQPTCKGLKSVKSTLICDHRIACTFYATSLKPSCSYSTTICNSFKTESSGTFNGCNSGGTGTATMQMGYYATKNGQPGNYVNNPKSFC